jgi:PcfJ-like protein
VSSAEAFVRHHKRQTDRAISQAYSRLAGDPLARATFSTLLGCVRKRSVRILAGPPADGHHPGVEALLHLARFRTAHVRSISSWDGCEQSWRRGISSLAMHLAARYEVPRFLGSAWCAGDGAHGDAKRRWFIAHGGGARFRSLDLPVRMTKRMEQLFLASADHFTIEYALRRAELLALGARDDLADAVLATRLAGDLTNSDFWRTVWMFLIAHAGEIALDRVGPIVDFIHAQPNFCMKGRTPASLLRLMDRWHRGLGLVSGGSSWDRSRIRPMVHSVPAQDPHDPPVVWEFVELTNGAQLKAEGSALKHCVAGYAAYCQRGTSRIWSLRSRRASHVRPVITIEIDPRRHAIVQARGFRNRLPAGKALGLLRLWAAREGLCVAMM